MNEAAYEYIVSIKSYSSSLSSHFLCSISWNLRMFLSTFIDEMSLVDFSLSSAKTIPYEMAEHKK